MIVSNQPQITALPLRPASDAKPPAQQPDPPSGEAKVVWASPDLAKALGSPVLGLAGIPGLENFGFNRFGFANSALGSPGIGYLRAAAPALSGSLGAAKVYPLQPQEAKIGATVAQGVQFLDDAGVSIDDVLHGIVDQSVQNRQLSADSGRLFSCTIAGAEILLELSQPSDKSAFEKALSISLNSLTILEPVTEWVPHLACARPYLVGIVEIGGQILAAVRDASKDAQGTPPRAGSPLAKAAPALLPDKPKNMPNK